MEVKVDVTDTKATVTVDGKLTVQTAPDLETAINEIDPQVTNLDIDLANVDYISSAGKRTPAERRASVCTRLTSSDWSSSS